MQKVQGDPGSAGSERMTQGNSAAVDVGSVPIEPQLLLDRKILG
jgi:hypothetical protein